MKITELVLLRVTLGGTHSHFKMVPPTRERGSQEQSVHKPPFAAFLGLRIHSAGMISEANFVCLHSCCHLTFGNLAGAVACGQLHFFSR